MTSQINSGEMARDHAEAEAPVLEVRQVSKVYHGSGRKGSTVLAVDRVSLSVGVGEILVIIGESGSGKSTLGRIFLGLVEPDDGEVLFRGSPITAHNRQARREYRRSVQAVFQNPQRSFNPSRTIGGSIREALTYAGELSSQKRVDELLALVHLNPEVTNRRPDQMSGGELQRAAIARALAPNPDVIFLDEPTSALDASIRGQIINLLIEIQETIDASLIWVTHELPVARAVAHRIAVMYMGEVVEQGLADQFIRSPRHPYSIALLGESGLPDAATVEGPPSEGCRFAPRCPLAQPSCWAERQSLRVVDERLVRCWRSGGELKGSGADWSLEARHVS